MVLPFGLASACYAFTKLTRPLIKKWRNTGTRCAMYIDDGIFGAKSFEHAKNICTEVSNDLRLAELTINKVKSKLTPMQNGKWLGFIIDTKKMQFIIPEEKKTGRIAQKQLCKRQRNFENSRSYYFNVFGNRSYSKAVYKRNV